MSGRPVTELDAALKAELDLADALDGFDLDHVGFDCVDALQDEWIENTDAFKWHCPFQSAPGCGATKKADCPALKQMARVVAGTKVKQ